MRAGIKKQTMADGSEMVDNSYGTKIKTVGVGYCDSELMLPCCMDDWKQPGHQQQQQMKT